MQQAKFDLEHARKSIAIGDYDWVLFGSFGRGDYTAASDADILLILKESSRRFDERIPLCRPHRVGVSVDVFPYTLAEARRSLLEGWGVVPVALREGELLYCACASLRDTLEGEANVENTETPLQ